MADINITTLNTGSVPNITFGFTETVDAVALGAANTATAQAALALQAKNEAVLASESAQSNATFTDDRASAAAGSATEAQQAASQAGESAQQADASAQAAAQSVTDIEAITAGAVAVATVAAELSASQAGSSASEAATSAASALASKDASALSASEALASKNAASQSASDALASKNAAAGQVQDTIEAIQANAQSQIDAALTQIGYLPPVPYASGLSVTNPMMTVEYGGTVYAPIPSATPFTTGSWDSSKWRVVQGVTEQDLSSTAPGKGAGMIGWKQDSPAASMQLAIAELMRTIRPEHFGATGDGVADDTVGFKNALNYAASLRMALTVTKDHVLGTIAVPELASIRGTAPMGYDFAGLVAKPQNSPQMKLKAGSAILFDVTGAKNFTFSGLHLSSASRSGIAVTGGGTRGTMENMTIRDFSRGIGGNTGGRDAYLRQWVFDNVVVSNCDIGVLSPIDSHFTNVQLNGSRLNLLFQAGANNNVFNGGRIEWSDEQGMDIYNADHLRFIGTNFDRAGWVAVKMVGPSANATFVGCTFSRNGKNSAGAADRDAHFYVEGCKGPQVIGGKMTTGGDDGGGGYVSPARVMRINCDTSDDVMLLGVDLRNASTSGIVVSNVTGKLRPNNWRMVGCFGQRDEINSTAGTQFENWDYFDKKFASAPAGGSVPLVLGNLPPLASFSSASYTLRVRARDPNTGALMTARIPVIIQVEIGTAATVAMGAPFATVKNIYTNDWAIAGTAGMVASVSSPLASGAGFTLTVNNYEAEDGQVEAWIER